MDYEKRYDVKKRFGEFCSRSWFQGLHRSGFESDENKKLKKSSIGFISAIGAFHEREYLAVDNRNPVEMYVF
jgi:hypothetical protein